MKLHELKAPAGARQSGKRAGRGTGSGHGKTAGRGQKGQLARSQGFRIGFEGGQMPLAQRLPKLGGFKNPFKKVYAVVNLTKLNRFQQGSKVGIDLLYESGLAVEGEEIKVLGAGRLRRKLDVEAHAFSESARAAIESRGGSVTVLGEPKETSAAKEKPAPRTEVEAPEAEPRTSAPREDQPQEA
jgi:large subunit ribosomal protein L15